MIRAKIFAGKVFFFSLQKGKVHIHLYLAILVVPDSMWCFLTKMFQGVREVGENCRKAEGRPRCGGWQERQGST